MKNFIIIDWANNLMFDGIDFETFQDGWDYIYENVEDDEMYEDLFVVEKSSRKGSAL
jgi:hypothetical protein